MHALRAYAENDPTQLVYEAAPAPDLTPGDVLLRVGGSGVSPAELSWPSTWLTPAGERRPLPIIPGHEVSGVVVALGPDAEGLAIGDEVYGLLDFQRDGADAELVAAQASRLAPKPRSLDHLQTATVPLSALTAWQALFDHAGLAPGQRVLIHGAGGGVGLYAVQFALWRGAHVIANAGARHATVLRDLGVREILDYHADRFDQQLRDVDVVFDTVGGATWEPSWPVLRSGGALVSVAVPRPPDTARRADVSASWFVVQADRAQLIEIAGLIDAGAVRPFVDRVLPLAQGRGAYLGDSRARGIGKIVLDVAGEPADSDLNPSGLLQGNA